MNYWKNIKDKLDAIYNALQDEESRELFDARVKYMIDRDSDSYIAVSYTHLRAHETSV